MSKLNKKHELFALEYVKTLNATEAYANVYHVDNPNVCASAGARLLRNVKVKAYIDELLKQIQSEKIATAEEVLIGLTAIARGDIEEELLEDYSLHYKIRALELLGKTHSLFTDKIDVKSQNETNINLSGNVFNTNNDNDANN